MIERKLKSLKNGKVVQDREQTRTLEKAQTFWSCLIGRKRNSLIGRKLNSLKSGEVVQVFVAHGVVGLGGVDKEQAGPPEKARTLCLEGITNSLLAKARTVWSCLIGRKLNSLRSDEVVQVVDTNEIVDLVRADKEQAKPMETAGICTITKNGDSNHSPITGQKS